MATAGNQQHKFDSFLHTYEKSFQALLDHSEGSWHAVLSRARFLQQSVMAPVFAGPGLADKLDVQQLADKGTDVHVKCNTKIQTSDAQFKKDVKKMVAPVDMLSEDMPYEGALATG